MIRLRRSCSGQASAEYVAVVLAVALLMAAAVTAAIALNPPFGRQVMATIRQGICIVWADVCTSADARAAGFAPCPIDVRRDEGRSTVRVAWFQLAHGNAVRVERRSDGTVSVSFTDQEEVGAELSPGVKVSPLGLDASVGADVGVTFTKGKTWDFRDDGAAKRFLERYAAREGLGGEAKAVGRRVGVVGGTGLHCLLPTRPTTRPALTPTCSGAWLCHRRVRARVPPSRRRCPTPGPAAAGTEARLRTTTIGSRCRPSMGLRAGSPSSGAADARSGRPGT